MSIAERIRETRETNEMTQQEFARKLSIDQAEYESIEAGNASMSIAKVMEMSTAFAANSHWLIYGVDSQEGHPDVGRGSKFMPLIDESAVAGYLEHDGNDDYLKSLEFYKIPGFNEGEHCIFKVHGESMVPTIEEKDQLICTRCKSIDELADNELIVVVTEKDIVVKRVGFLPDKKDRLLLKSDNPEYRIYSIPLEEIREIWKVKAKITESLGAMKKEDKRIAILEQQLEELRKTFDEFSRNFLNSSNGENGEQA